MSKGNVFHLYFSRLILNPRSKQVMSELDHPYEMHRTLMRAFPQLLSAGIANARERSGVLFRAENDQKSAYIKVYVQSTFKPDWSRLDDLDGYLCGRTEGLPYEQKDIWPTYLTLKCDQILSFYLRANPTKRIAKKDDPMKGKRVELWRENEQIAWLQRKGKDMGNGKHGGFIVLTEELKDEQGKTFQIPRVHVGGEGKHVCRKKDKLGKHSTTHFAAHFRGLLQITDPDAFRQTLVSGIGSGKAYGFGLLSIAPPR